jgi:hypothetical protein
LNRIDPTFPSNSTHQRNPVLNSVFEASAGEDRSSLQAGIQARRNIWMASRQPATQSAQQSAGAPLPGVLLL